MTTPTALPSPTPRRLPIGKRICGTAGFLAAVCLLRFPLKHSVSVIGKLGRCVGRPASVEEGEVAVAAARLAARWYPGRAACLEYSLAATLTAFLLGRRVNWCIGVRLMPYAAHAWVEAQGQPVGEPHAPDRPYLLLQRT